jgi:hypothetical protein
MAWAIGNLKIEVRGNAILATKQLAGAGKIDPAMAMFDAVSLMAENPQNRRSIYDSMSEDTLRELTGASSGGGDDDDDVRDTWRRTWLKTGRWRNLPLGNEACQMRPARMLAIRLLTVQNHGLIESM